MHGETLKLGRMCFFEAPVEAEEKVEHGKHKYTRTELYGSSPVDEINALCAVRKTDQWR